MKSNQLKKTLLALGVVSSMALAGIQSAQALQMTWDYKNTDGWTAYTPAGTIPTGVEGSQNNDLGAPTLLEWGEGSGQPLPSSLELGNNNGDVHYGQHTGSVTTNVFSYSNISAQITHNNNVIGASDQELETFTLTGRLDLTPTPDAPGFPVDVPFFGFFEETLNAVTCFTGSVSVCDDIFVLTNPEALVLPFSYNGDNYEAYLTAVPGSDFGDLSDAACGAAGVAAGCFGWQTQEGQSNVLNMALNIRSVPEPTILALMGLGLTGLGFARRNKKQAKQAA